MWLWCKDPDVFYRCPSNFFFISRSFMWSNYIPFLNSYIMWSLPFGIIKVIYIYDTHCLDLIGDRCITIRLISDLTHNIHLIGRIKFCLLITNYDCHLMKSIYRNKFIRTSGNSNIFFYCYSHDSWDKKYKMKLTNGIKKQYIQTFMSVHPDKQFWVSRMGYTITDPVGTIFR